MDGTPGDPTWSFRTGIPSLPPPNSLLLPTLFVLCSVSPLPPGVGLTLTGRSPGHASMLLLPNTHIPSDILPFFWDVFSFFSRTACMTGPHSMHIHKSPPFIT